jgi:hypothetical protein
MFTLNTFAQDKSVSEPKDFAQKVMSMSCPEDLKVWRKQVEGLKNEAEIHLNKHTKMAVHAKLINLEPDMTFISLYWPDMLKVKVDYSAMYTDCYKRQLVYFDDPSEDNLNNWTSCVIFRYGEDQLPPIFTKISQCYSQILEKNKNEK